MTYIRSNIGHWFECGLFHDENGYLCKSESWSLARLKKAIRYDSCADPGIFVRWGEGGGGGGSGPSGILKSSDKVVFIYFLVLILFYRSPVVTFKENYYLPRFKWGWNIFQGEGGVQLLFPYRNPYNVWFSRGGGGVGTAWPPSGSAHVIPRIAV